MLNKRACDKKGVRDDAVSRAAYSGCAAAKGDVMDFVAVFAVAVAGDGTFETFQDDIGNMKIIFAKGKVQVIMVKSRLHKCLLSSRSQRADGYAGSCHAFPAYSDNDAY